MDRPKLTFFRVIYLKFMGVCVRYFNLVYADTHTIFEELPAVLGSVFI